MRKDLAGRLDAIREDCQVPAGRIRLELTEQSMADYTMLREQVTALRDLGYQFSLDDYGSGASNLTRVRQYPFQNIKLDMEVVWNYCQEPDPLLPALVSAFKQMGYTVTAEGIETEEMGRAMVEIGCDYLQGFYYSRPLPIADFSEQIAG
jgi:EAL domain-containing protein (putative c-di-GMP-specific phosphodiesterase class I)